MKVIRGRWDLNGYVRVELTETEATELLAGKVVTLDERDGSRVIVMVAESRDPELEVIEHTTVAGDKVPIVKVKEPDDDAA